MPLVESSFRNRKSRTLVELRDAVSELEARAFAPITVKVPRASVDPYEAYRLKEAAIGGASVMAQLTYDHPDSVRARKVAALREDMGRPFERRFPPEGRSCRVYAENIR